MGHASTKIVLFLCLLISFGIVSATIPQAAGHSGTVINANFSDVYVTLDGDVNSTEWSDAKGVKFYSAAGYWVGNVDFLIKQYPAGKCLFASFSVPDSSLVDNRDWVSLALDTGGEYAKYNASYHTGWIAPTETDYLFLAYRNGSAVSMAGNRTTWDKTREWTPGFSTAVNDSGSGWSVELRINGVDVISGRVMGIQLRQRDYTAETAKAKSTDRIVNYPWNSNVSKPSTWANVRFTKQNSSITASLSKTPVSIEEELNVTAALTPPSSNGTVTLSYSKDAGPWTTIASGSPSNGVYVYTWRPGAFGAYQVRASWSGDEVYNSTTSAVQMLIVAPLTITVDSSPRVSSITVDGWVYSTTILPKSFQWQSGSTHTLSIVDAIVNKTTGQRYVFDQWSDGSTSTSRTITATGSTSYTARFKTQYFLTVNSPYEGAQCQGWYDSGATASCSVTPMTDLGNQTRLKFSSWTGSLTSTSPSITVVMSGVKSVTALWKTQYYLQVNSEYGNPRGEGWYDAKAYASFNVTFPIEYGNGTRLAFAGWSGDSMSTNPSSSIMMNAPKNVTAQSNIQYYLKVTSPYGSPRGSGWYDREDVAYFSVSSPIDYGNGTGLVFTQWSGDSISNQSDTSIVMDLVKTVSANWEKRYRLTVTSSYGAPQGEDWYGVGTQAQVSVKTPFDQGNGTRRIFMKWSGDLNSPSSKEVIIVDSPKTVRAEWSTQYYFRVDALPGVATGENWFDRGAEATAVAVSPSQVIENKSRLLFTGWSGDVRTNQSRVFFVMNRPHEVRANWKTQYYLEIDPRIGEVSQASQWVDSGASIKIEAKSPAEVVPETSRRVFAGWSGSYSTAQNPLSITMNSANTLTANWKTQYYLKVTSPHGEPQGEGWYDKGTSATFSVQSPTGLIIQQAFTGWFGDSQSEAATASITMDSAKTVTARWSPEYTQLYILVGAIVAAAVAGGVIAVRRRK